MKSKNEFLKTFTQKKIGFGAQKRFPL